MIVKFTYQAFSYTGRFEKLLIALLRSHSDFLDMKEIWVVRRRGAKRDAASYYLIVSGLQSFSRETALDADKRTDISNWLKQSW